MCVNGIRFDKAVLFGRSFGRINFRNLHIRESIRIFLSKFVVLFQFINFGLLQFSSEKGFRQNLVLSVFAHTRINVGGFFDFGKFVIDIDETFVSFVAPKARRHVNGFVRGSDLKLLGWVLDGFGRFGCDELWLDVFACCNVFFV
jgi:hypothetical protein